MKEKILLALSDPSLTNTLVEILKKAGYQPDSVLNGKEVIEKLKSYKPDLLLIDIVLPEKTGYEVLNEKSFDRDVTKIPVIIISNSGEPIQIQKIPSTPVIKDYIITTHVEPNEVIEKIEKAFGRGPLYNEEKSPKSEVTGKGKKILWVDDDKLLSAVLSKKFISSGFSLLKAKNGAEFFKFLETEVPHIIILDIKLPDANGLDILQKVKINAAFKQIPVIILTNNHRQTYFDTAKMLGAIRFLTKASISPEEIVKEVDTVLKTTHQVA